MWFKKASKSTKNKLRTWRCTQIHVQQTSWGRSFSPGFGLDPSWNDKHESDDHEGQGFSPLLGSAVMIHNICLRLDRHKQNTSTDNLAGLEI